MKVTIDVNNDLYKKLGKLPFSLQELVNNFLPKLPDRILTNNKKRELLGRSVYGAATFKDFYNDNLIMINATVYNYHILGKNTKFNSEDILTVVYFDGNDVYLFKQ